MSEAAFSDQWDLALGTPVVPAPTDNAFANRERRPDCADLPPTLVTDDVWPLHHLVHSDHGNSANVRFDTFPSGLRQSVKVYLYNLLNTPPQRRTASMKATLPSPGSVGVMMRSVRYLTEWMSDRRLTFPQMTTDSWNAYAEEVASKRWVRAYKLTTLIAVSRLWAHNCGLPEPYSFCSPPWFGTDLVRWLGRAQPTSDNRTEPLPPDLIADLMHASLALIDGYLDGTVTLGSRGNYWKAEARQWAIAQGLSIPADGITREQGEAWKTATNWAPRFDKGDVRAACFIVLSYLTGMRPQEVLHLERGCLTVGEESDGFASTATRYRIKARTFKNVRGADGNAIGTGRERIQPWVTIAPAAKAVEALERLNPQARYLFALILTNMGINGQERQRRGDIVTVTVMRASFYRLIAKWNRHAAHDGRRAIRLASTAKTVTRHNGLDIIDADSAIPIAPTQFRRTLAWHIANQPGGEVALGVQYGHLKTVISLGYAGRAESGFPDELELDALLGNWDRLDDLANEVQDGSAVSGTAAPRVREAFTHFVERFQGHVRTDAELNRFKSAGLHLIHDNPNAHNVCAYNPALALCHPDRQQDDARQTPDLTNCQRGCPNIALLDTHAAAKERNRLALLDEAEHLPAPLAERNRLVAADLQRDLDRHQAAQANQHSATRNEELS
ncbi:hypothetical protein [Brevibacterium litoralis]|uniref:hypothetical protein n=1 Tax=Brevibacterium litoralis TaxID=3138935 RepID=UPI0032ED1620